MSVEQVVSESPNLLFQRTKGYHLRSRLVTIWRCNAAVARDDAEVVYNKYFEKLAKLLAPRKFGSSDVGVDTTILSRKDMYTFFEITCA